LVVAFFVLYAAVVTAVVVWFLRAAVYRDRRASPNAADRVSRRDRDARWGVLARSRAARG
jgi:hypothetical protein